MSSRPTGTTLFRRVPAPRVPARAAGRRRWLEIAGLVALFVVTAATRAAVAGHTLINWDAVQYALGLQHFDVVRHQPHPPGSIFYIGLGKLALVVAGDANLALSAISVLAGALSVVLCYVTAREVFGTTLAWAGTALYATSPLTWFYGAVALPYSLEGALSLAAVLLCWRALEEKDRRAALWAALVLAAAGGVRQTTMLLLLPLWIYSAIAADWPLTRARPIPTTLVSGGIILGALCLMWAVPLVVLTGGIAPYLAASRELSTLASADTSLLAVGLVGPAGNIQYMWDVASFGLNLTLVCFAVYLLPIRRARWPWRPNRAQFWFLLLWLAPALAVYTVIHVGQGGYLLLFWPLVCVAGAQAALSVSALVTRPAPLRLIAATTVVALLCAANAAVFLLPPRTIALGGSTAAAIREQDLFWQRVVDLANVTGSARTVILSGTRSTESFRHAGYYLPAFHVLAIGADREGTLGVAFQSFQGEHDYARFMAGGEASVREPLPAGTTQLLILDESVADLFSPADLREVAIVPGRIVWVYPTVDFGTPLRDLTFPHSIAVQRG